MTIITSSSCETADFVETKFFKLRIYFNKLSDSIRFGAVLLWYGLGRPVITSEIGNWSVFVLLGWRFVFGIIIKRDGREPHSQMPSRLWEE